MNLQTKQEHQKKNTLIFACLLCVKICVLAFFSSNYQNNLFIPFVKHFLNNFDNPWNYFYQNPTAGIEFPYSPVMLYILSIFYAPIHWCNINLPLLNNIFFKMPTLLADIIIFRLLTKIYPNKKRNILIYYFAAPIIFYACYVHSQVDLIPTTLLFLSVYLLTKGKTASSAISLGLAMSTKLHVVAALPLMLIYAQKKYSFKETAQLLLLSVTTFFVIIFPFYGEGFTHFVLNNPEQSRIYDVFFLIGDVKMYLPVLFVSIFYARFSAFRKINNDLLYTFLALVFSTFVALTFPSPAWYVWLFPFISIFFIKTQEKKPEIFKLFLALNIAYLIYIILFYLPEHADIIFIKQQLSFKLANVKFKNISFTILEAILLTIMYVFYKFGIKSNVYYIKNSPTVIGIAGDSAAGKSTLLSDIKMLLGKNVLEMEGDDDHKWERGDNNWEDFTHLNPKANFLHRQYDDIGRLKRGKSILRAEYNHSTGKFYAPQKVHPDDFIVISGLHSFYLPKMRTIIDLKIYVDTDDALRKHWKIVRDVGNRNKTKKNTLASMKKREGDAKKYIHPQYDFSDIVVRYFTDDAFDLGNKHASFKMKLKITLGSNIPLAQIVSKLEKEIHLTWDYSQDLKNQYLIVDGPIPKESIEALARRYIVNLEDLLGKKPEWLDGYRGLVQLMILLCLSEKIKSLGEKEREKN
ncbi:uridine kinase [Candidatus Omnitrophota bacterium]